MIGVKAITQARLATLNETECNWKQAAEEILRVTSPLCNLLHTEILKKKLNDFSLLCNAVKPVATRNISLAINNTLLS